MSFLGCCGKHFAIAVFCVSLQEMELAVQIYTFFNILQCFMSFFYSI